MCLNLLWVTTLDNSPCSPLVLSSPFLEKGTGLSDGPTKSFCFSLCYHTTRMVRGYISMHCAIGSLEMFFGCYTLAVMTLFYEK